MKERKMNILPLMLVGNQALVQGKEVVLAH
jgi:hypothetical protein